MEAHATQRQVDQIEADGRFEPQRVAALPEMVLAAAGDAVARLDWNRVRKALAQRRGYPVQITQ